MSPGIPVARQSHVAELSLSRWKNILLILMGETANIGGKVIRGEELKPLMK